MTYKGKTIAKHQRGNWYVRVRYNNKVIAIYGRTQLETYAKLKVLCDKIEKERLSAQLQKIERIDTQPIVKTESKQERTTYTLIEWFDEWLNSYKIGNVRIASIDSFKKTIVYLEKLYDVNINEINNLMLSRAINEVLGTRSKDKVHNLCRQMFNIAFNNRLIDTNPTLTIPRPKQCAKYEKKAFTPEQERKFIDLCLADIDTYEPLLVCVLQGLRKGEMLALRPNDFDFERNTLRVDESYDHNYPDDLMTKNETSKRTMPMFALTRQLLLKYADQEPNKRIYESIQPAALTYRLLTLLKKNGLPRMTLHELRHTFITRCHEKGIDEIVVQKWVGHAKGSRMTKAIYTHINDDAERKYIETLNQKAI